MEDTCFWRREKSPVYKWNSLKVVSSIDPWMMWFSRAGQKGVRDPNLHTCANRAYGRGWKTSKSLLVSS